MPLISVDDISNQLVAHHIAFGEINARDSGSAFQCLQSLDQTGTLVWRQVDLRYVASHNAFGMRSHSGQEHEHLFRCRVLRFIENNEGVAQGPSTHIREWRDLNGLPRDQALHLLGFQHIAQRVVEWPKIRRDLLEAEEMEQYI